MNVAFQLVHIIDNNMTVVQRDISSVLLTTPGGLRAICGLFAAPSGLYSDGLFAGGLLAGGLLAGGLFAGGLFARERMWSIGNVIVLLKNRWSRHSQTVKFK